MQAHFLKNGEAQITQAVSGLPTQRRLLMSGTQIHDLISTLYAHAMPALSALPAAHAMQYVCGQRSVCLCCHHVAMHMRHEACGKDTANN